MLKKFLKTIQEHKMIQRGDGIVIGVSGGPDSICLLHLLCKIQKEYDLKLYVVHLNHQFRGDAADQDAAYVEKICKKLNIPAFIYTRNVEEYSKDRGITFEEGGREIRYDLFEEVLKKTKSKKIAVAQNMDDQAETVLMRLMRGSGLEGLCAISYVRDEKIIRPILDISRYEIEDYCEKNNLHPRIDHTNLETIYTRNRIRLEFIPYIQKYFNPNIKETLSRTANVLREDKNFIEDYQKDVYDIIVKRRDKEICIDKILLKRQHRAIQKRILRQAIWEMVGNLKDIQMKHIQSIINLVEKNNLGNKIDLPRGLWVRIEEEYLIFSIEKKEIEKYDFEYNINIGEILYLQETSSEIFSHIMDRKDLKQISKEDHVKLFDYDKIRGNLVIRNRKDGDRFFPLGMKGSKKLKDFFIDEKIPKQKRDEIPLICDEKEIMWIVGYRVSEKYKIDQDTKKILVMSYKKKK
ncbi:tRNA lysidine(34) synthetase TilS [Inediibacterium massiliense]|uniref:tRNA lysidine(34) synthetase TilS n=1 Tax=Inediibacterium massiliense TaxID=1658111 RepID=UPI0006B54142|nr:tRNA lysidine(34) synthetase TilS [Inediibacterium massiliense]